MFLVGFVFGSIICTVAWVLFISYVNMSIKNKKDLDWDFPNVGYGKGR